MLTTLLTAPAVIGACISALVAIGTALYGVYTKRKAEEASPEMVANNQAKTDLSIEEAAEKAVDASDKGDLTLERKGDAE